MTRAAALNLSGDPRPASNTRQVHIEATSANRVRAREASDIGSPIFPSAGPMSCHRLAIAQPPSATVTTTNP